MSLRIHKAIGYGLADLKKNDPRVDIDRLEKLLGAELQLNPFILWAAANQDKLRGAELAEGYSESLRDHAFSAKMFLSSLKRSTAQVLSRRVLVRDAEFGLARVLVLLPPESLDWYRCDDIIDYTEEPYKARCKVLKHSSGIHPYNGYFVRFRLPSKRALSAIGELNRLCAIDKAVRLDDAGLPCGMPAGLYNGLVGRWDPKVKPVAQGKLLSHLLDDWRPRLPRELIWILAYAEPCMRDARAFKNSLRPMLYVYWS